MFDGAVKQAVNCPKIFKDRPSEDDIGTKSDNEESDKSCYSWPNGVGNIKLVRMTKSTCVEFCTDNSDSEMKEDSTPISISLALKT